MTTVVETKFFELRDHGTLIPLMCVRLKHDSSDRSRASDLIARGGFFEGVGVFATHLQNAKSQCDPYAWRDRTLQTAHLHVMAHWDELRNGDLIDVRVILGERPALCETELNTPFVEGP